MKPSTIKDRYWEYAWAPPPLRAGTLRVGKWLLFIPEEALDEAWMRIQAAVVAGKLGPAAKTRTASPGPLGDWLNVICIYTRDADDVADRERVRREVAALGFTQELAYKTDAETLEDALRHPFVAASTWADGKKHRHLFPLVNAGRTPLCGLKAGLHGWENHNHVMPDKYNPIYCRACLAKLESGGARTGVCTVHGPSCPKSSAAVGLRPSARWNWNARQIERAAPLHDAGEVSECVNATEPCACRHACTRVAMAARRGPPANRSSWRCA